MSRLLIFGCSPFLGCYDKETEILTRKGWVKVDDKNTLLSEEILTLNPSSLEMEYQRALDYFEYDYEGKMFKLKRNKNIDLLVTPNHRFLIKTQRGKYRIREAKNLPNWFGIPRVGTWKGKEQEVFVLPAVPNKNKSRVKERVIPMDIWLEFLGYYIAEGSVTKQDYKVQLRQNEGKLLDRMVKVMRVVSPFVAKRRENGVYTRDKQLYTYLLKLGKCHDKYIPKEFKNLSSRQIFILFMALVKGDGHIDKRFGHISYFTSSKKLKDDFQEIVLKVGFSSHSEVMAKKGSEVLFTKENRFIKCREDIWRVSVKKTKIAKISKRDSKYQEWVDFKGKVYCPSTPNGVVMIRRNGIAIFCGNSGYGGAIREIATHLSDKHEVFCYSEGYSGTLMKTGNFWVLPSQFKVEGGQPRGGLYRAIASIVKYKPNIIMVIGDLLILDWLRKWRFKHPEVPVISYFPVDAIPMRPSEVDIAKGFDYRVTPSNFGAEQVRHEGMDCTVIPHGVNTDIFKPRPQEEARAFYNWKDKRYVSLYVGTNSILEGEKVIYFNDGGLHIEPVENINKYSVDVPSVNLETLKISPSEGIYLEDIDENKDCYKILTTYNKSIKLTGDHSLFTAKRRTKSLQWDVMNLELTPIIVRNLKVGDYIAIARNPRIPEKDRKVINYKVEYKRETKSFEDKITNGLLRFLGIYLAEGSFRKPIRTIGGRTYKDYHISIDSDYATCLWCSNYLKTLFIKGKIPIWKDKQGYRISIGNQRLVTLIEALGFTTGSHKKDIPKWVLQLPLERLKPFLIGYTEGDGHKVKDKNEYKWSTVSEKLASNLVILLSRFGLVSSNRPKIAKFKGKEHPYFLISTSTREPDISKWTDITTQINCYFNKGDIGLIKIKEITKIPNTKRVFDFSVEGKENFLSGDLILCHNTRRKCIPRMIEAYSKVFKDNKDAFLWIHAIRHDSSGWNIPQVLQFFGIENAGFSPFIDDLSYTPDELALVYNLADVYVSATSGEGYGLCTVEAMASGLPVILPDYSASPEVAKGCGLFPRIWDYELDGFSCVDEETECLTKKGFKFVKDVTCDDEIATLNPQTLELEYHKPTDIIKREYIGNMWECKGKTIDFRITETHRMLYKLKKHDKWDVKPFNEIMDKASWRIYFKKSAIWKGKEADKFIFDGIEYETTDFLKFLGWYLSEGWTSKACKNRWYLRICQSPESKYFNEIGELLKKMGFNYHILDKSTFSCLVKPELGEYLHILGKARTKYIPIKIKDLKSELLLLLLEAMWKGDGSFQRDRFNYYGTASKQLADDVVELLLKVGIAGTTKIRKIKRVYKGIDKEFTAYLVFANYEKLEPQLRFNPNTVNRVCKTQGQSLKKTFFSGQVYDVTVPNHIFYMRRGGKTLWSGNTWRAMVDVEDMADKMKILYNDEKLRKKLGKAGVKRVEENYSYKVTYPMWHKLIDSIEETWFKKKELNHIEDIPIVKNRDLEKVSKEVEPICSPQ